MTLQENQIYTRLIHVYCIYNMSSYEKENASELFA